MSRWRLHITKLDEFAAFCADAGWRRVPTKGTYEVLRMTRNGSAPLIVYLRDHNYRGNATEHCTIHGTSEMMFDQYQQSLQRMRPLQESSHERG